MKKPNKPQTGFASLLDYRRRVSDNYHHLRTSSLSPEATWAAFRQRRNQLFLSHPQSALNDAQKAKTSALPYFPYN
ncbi:MAG: hypothetical protein AAF629_25080, partial [Chloroflexota bacterium]